MSLGTRHIDDALTFYCTTTRFDTGAATDADSAPTYRVYEDETSTPILTGTMALLDSANTAGFYSEGITLSAANGFEIGKSYSIYITGAVNSVTGATVREFCVRKKPLTPTTEGRELTVESDGMGHADVKEWLAQAAAAVTNNGVPEVDITHIGGVAVSTSTAQLGVNVVNFGGSAGTFASGIPAVNATQISGDAAPADALEALYDTDGPHPQFGIVDQGTAQSASATGLVLRAGAAFADTTLVGMTLAVHGSTQGYWQTRVITANLLSGDAVTVDTWTVTPSGTITYRIFGSAPGASLADIAGAVLDADASSHTTNSTLGAIINDWEDAGRLDTILDARASQTSVDTVDNFVDTEIAALQTAITGIVPVSGTIGATGNTTTALHLDGLAWADNGPNSMLLTIKDVSTGLFYSRWIEDFATTGDLATVATLPFTPEASVDLYWVTAVRADVTGGSGLDAAGVRAAIGLASANLDTQLSAIDDLVDTEVAAIKTDTAAILIDTNELQTDWVNGGRLDLILDTAAAGSLDAAGVRAAVGLASANLDTQLADLPTNAELTTALGTADDAVLAAVAASDAKLDTIDNFLDTEVAAILAAVDTETAAIKAKTDSLTFTVAAELDVNVQSINGTGVTGNGGGTPWGPA
jgi:hypothetical protein